MYACTQVLYFLCMYVCMYLSMYVCMFVRIVSAQMNVVWKRDDPVGAHFNQNDKIVVLILNFERSR